MGEQGEIRACWWNITNTLYSANIRMWQWRLRKLSGSEDTDLRKEKKKLWHGETRDCIYWAAAYKDLRENGRGREKVSVKMGVLICPSCGGNGSDTAVLKDGLPTMTHIHLSPHKPWRYSLHPILTISLAVLWFIRPHLTRLRPDTVTHAVQKPWFLQWRLY